jgi:hypothetical protein
MSRLLIILSFVCILANASKKIYVKTLYGKIITLPVSNDLGDNILFVKKAIEKSEGIIPDQQWLILNGKILEDDKKLSDYDIEYGSELRLAPRLRPADKGTQPAKTKNVENTNPKSTSKDKNEGKKKDSNDLGKKMAIAYVIGILVGVSAVLIWHFVTKSVKNNEGENDEEENQSQHAIKETDAVINVKDLKNPNAAEEAY